MLAIILKISESTSKLLCY